MPWVGGWAYENEVIFLAFWRPETTVYVCADTGIDAQNKPYFESNAAMAGYCIGKAKKTLTEYSYQRADERQYIACDMNYDEALACDCLVWKNAGTGPTYIIANITGFEWKNPNCTWIYFKVDAFCTFCGSIDWNHSYCYVEREHVTVDWNGGVPNWQSMGVAESFNLDPEEMTFEHKEVYEPNKYIVITPYNEDGTPNFGGGKQHGIYDGLTQLTFSSPADVNSYLEAVAESEQGDIANIVGVYSLPDKFINGSQSSVTIVMPWTDHTQYNNAKCWSSQFCVISVMSMDGQSADFKPELFKTGVYSFAVQGYFVGGSFGFRVTPQSYAGHTSDNVDIGFFYSGVPQGAFVGNAYAQYLAANSINIASKLITGSIKAGLGLAAGVATAGTGAGALDVAASAGRGGLTAGVNDIVSLFGSMQSARKSSATIGGTGNNADVNISTAAAGYGYYIRVYMPRESYMFAIDSFFDRFGYRICRTKVPNRNTRPCWNYVKTVDGHVEGSIPANYRADIEAMLNAGVTFWHTGACQIGDYSDGKKNKA